MSRTRSVWTISYGKEYPFPSTYGILQRRHYLPSYVQLDCNIITSPYRRGQGTTGQTWGACIIKYLQTSRLMCDHLQTYLVYGISVNLVIYLLREGDSPAATHTNNWQGALFFCSVVGGFLGDAVHCHYSLSAYRFNRGCTNSFVGYVNSLRPPSCKSPNINCKSASKTQIGLFYGALYIIALGFGAYEPNVLSFGADQFDEEHHKEKVQKNDFFNWFYAALTLGTLLGSTSLAYIENEGKWTLGFWISTGAGALAFVVFLGPTHRYRFHKTGGNPITRIAQVVVAAIRKKHVQPPSQSEQLYEVANTEAVIKGSRKIIHSNALRFFDKAATVTDTDFDKRSVQVVSNPWRLCTVTQVEELKWLCRMLPVWACTIFYSTAYTQVFSLFVIQGAAMDTQLGSFHVPPAGLYAVDCVTVVVCVMAYNYWLVPWARKRTGLDSGLTGLQRIGSGMPLIAVAMMEAGVVEMARRHKVQRGGNLSILWQIPLYITTGISETFTYIGAFHFFYDQAPDAMRSLGSALPQASIALGNYVSSSLITIVNKGSGSPGWLPASINDGHLYYFFFLLGALSVVNFFLFLLSSMYYQYTARQDLSPSAQALPFLQPHEMERS